MVTLLLATRNAHKTEEIRAMLGDQFRLLTLNDFPAAPSVTEDAGSFAGNATKKAVALAHWLSLARPPTLAPPDSGLWTPDSGLSLPRPSTPDTRPSPATFVLADDSGLEVDALGGAPGVYSARFAATDAPLAGNSPDSANNAKLLPLLEDIPLEKRTARFRCVLALTPVLRSLDKSASPVCYTDEFELQTELFEGVCEGRIGFAPRGQNGFGYDPLFIPLGHDQTFAELGEAVKNQLSHRAKALAKLKQRLSQ
jgi:XTP/dITP diphosphohydrolase